MFIPDSILYEKEIFNYELGNKLMKKYASVEKKEIDNHNNILEMRQKGNTEFPKMKNNLIIGVRKTHKFVENHKVSDFLVPYTSSRLYCDVYVLLSCM